MLTIGVVVVVVGVLNAILVGTSGPTIRQR